MTLPGGLPTSERSCKMWLSWAFQILEPFKIPNSRRERKGRQAKDISNRNGILFHNYLWYKYHVAKFKILKLVNLNSFIWNVVSLRLKTGLHS